MKQHTEADNNISTPLWRLVAVWALVLLPLSWGLIETLIKSSQMFV